jgi:methylated-DNA-[protein]-cysteine S-methyltransferase
MTQESKRTIMSSNLTLYTVLESPIGDLLLASDGRSLTDVSMGAHDGFPARDGSWRRDDGALGPARRQLAAYFEGDRREFDLPLALRGTDFQRRVWDALRRVPFGATISYAELAARIGAPYAARAVGAALGRNPVAIVVPCHRIIGSSGGLGGFGGGLDRKRWLLEHERTVDARHADDARQVSDDRFALASAASRVRR